MKGSPLVRIPESVSCFFRLTASITFLGSALLPAGAAVSAQGLLGSSLLVERRWGGTGQGHCCGHVCILPQSPLTVPPGTSDFLGLALSATSFTDYTL